MDEIDKTSVNYFFTQMTQEEFEKYFHSSFIDEKDLKPHKFNLIRRYLIKSDDFHYQ